MAKKVKKAKRDIRKEIYADYVNSVRIAEIMEKYDVTLGQIEEVVDTTNSKR